MHHAYWLFIQLFQGGMEKINENFSDEMSSVQDCVDTARQDTEAELTRKSSDKKSEVTSASTWHC